MSAPARLDVRLLLPAMVAWAALVLLLPRPPWLVVTVALSALGLAGVGMLARRGRWALIPAVTGVLLLCAAGHLMLARVGPMEERAREGAVVQVTGVVTGAPRVLARGDGRADLVVLELRVERLVARGAVSHLRAPVVVFADPSWARVPWRSRVLASGRLSTPDAGAREVAVLTPRGPPEVIGSVNPVLRAAEVGRARLRTAVDPLPADARGLIPGLVIGDTSLTPPELSAAMLDTGLSHLAAVSGSNVAIVVGAVLVLSQAAGLPRRARPALAAFALVGFVLLCRPEPSVLRAATMGLVGLVAMSSARRRVSLPALGAAVVVLLTLDPWLARSHAFALSTLATLGLVVFARPWGLAIGRRLPPRCAVLGHAVAIPLAAQVVCAPVIVLLQGSVSTVAVLANLLAAPFVAPTTLGGIAAALVALLSPATGQVVAWAAALPAWLIARIARSLDVRWGTLDWVDGQAGAWLLTGLTLLLLLAGPGLVQLVRVRPWPTSGLLVGLALAMLPLPPVPGWRDWPPGGWSVVGCAVGQGDAFVIATGPGSAVLVDTGPDPDPVISCLHDLGVRRLEAVVLTHYHRDHVGGLAAVLDELPVEAVFVTHIADPPEQAAFVDAAVATAGVPVHRVAAGDRLSWGRRSAPTSATVLWPPPTLSAVVGANDASVVLDLTTAQGLRVLLLGDVEQRAAAGVRRAVGDAQVDVLKVAHHGSATQDDQLVLSIRPRVAMIGVGADNSFGHPAPSTLALLRRAGARVLRTDQDGAVAVSVRDGELSVWASDP